MKLEHYWIEKIRNIGHYCRTADMYDGQFSEEQKKKYKAALRKSPPYRGGYVLDVGCGTGLFIEDAMLRSYIVGVDCSKKMIKKAKQKYRSLNTAFICADADYLPFMDKVFEVIFSFTLLQNMPEPKMTVQEIYSVAKTGAHIVLTGLKKKFTKTSFLQLLKKLSIDEFINDEELNDFIILCHAL